MSVFSGQGVGFKRLRRRFAPAYAPIITGTGASGICHERAHFLRLPMFQNTLAQIKHIRWRPGSFLLPQRCSMWVCPHHLGIEFGQTHIEKLMKVFYWA